ncbi:hypothetical protein [Acetivibrio cellulolyticus]|uniref:hypothetical protein n=1 Tax=Acetivibrio cellulolyticus TaxID=35830 RepID=UPI0001E2C2A2|nr:hypothetical protein [Acetivibrio cellulolyticus]
MLCCDPAGTRNKGKKKDYYAFCVGSLADNDFKYVRKGEIFRFEYEDYIEHVLDLLRQFEDIQVVYIEKNTYAGADVIKLQELITKDTELRDRNITWINEHQNKNKDDKIQTIVGDVNNGRIIFNSEDEDFIQQIMDFQGCAYSAHDDAPDITSEFANRIETIETVKFATAFDRSKLGL